MRTGSFRFVLICTIWALGSLGVKADTLGGFTQIGSFNYPGGGMSFEDTFVYPGSDASLISTVAVDSAGEYAYFGTLTKPARLMKVDLSTFTVADSLKLQDDEGSIVAIFINAAETQAYVGLADPFGRVVQIDLSTFTRGTQVAVGATLRSGARDSAGNFGYFGASTSGSSRVVKFNLSTGTVSANLDLGSLGNLDAAVVNPADTYAYFGSSTGFAVRIDLTTFTFANSIQITGRGFIDAAVHPSGSHVFFLSQRNSTSRLEQLTSALASTASILFSSPDVPVGSLTVDPAGSFAYVGTDTFPARVIKVDLSTFTTVGSIALNSREDRFFAAAVDPAGDKAYFACYTIPGRIVKVDLATFAREAVLEASMSGAWISSSVIDASDSFAYFGTDTLPGQVLKFDLNTFQNVDTLTLAEADGGLKRGVIDQAENIAYFGTGAVPARILRIDLTSLTQTGILLLDSGEDFVTAAAIDPANDLGYFGIWTDPGRVVKVDLATMTRLGSVDFNTNELFPMSAVVDPAGQFGYFGINRTFQANLIKVDLVNMTRVAGLSLQTFTGSSFNPNALMMHPSGSRAYVGHSRSPGGPSPVNPINLDTFTMGTETASHALVFPTFGMIDPTGHSAFVAAQQHINRIELDPISFRVQQTAISMVNTTWNSGVVSSDGDTGYFVTQNDPSKVVKVDLSLKRSIRGSRISVAETSTMSSAHLFSQVPAGNVRLALYDDDPTTRALLWESDPIPNTVRDGWINVPVSSGTPAVVNLAPGDYYLAWQLDSTASIPRSITASAGDGFTVDGDFGPFPAEIGAGTSSPFTETPFVWRSYILYQGPPSEIDLSVSSVDFGERGILNGPTAPTSVVISNLEMGILDIMDDIELIGPDASQFMITSDTGETTLAQGNSRTVNVVFDPSTAGAKSAALRIPSDDPDEGTIDLPLSGVGTLENIQVSVTSLDFGTRDRDFMGLPALPVTITNTGNGSLSVSLSIFGANASAFQIHSDTGQTILGESQSRVLGISCNSLNLGAASATLRIDSNDPDQPQVDIPMTATTVDPDLFVNSAPVNFGPRDVLAGPSSAYQITLQSGGSTPLDVYTFEIDDPGAKEFILESPKTAPFTMTLGEVIMCNVYFDPIIGGPVLATLKIRSSDTFVGDVDIPLTGYGLVLTNTGGSWMLYE